PTRNELHAPDLDLLEGRLGRPKIPAALFAGPFGMEPPGGTPLPPPPREVGGGRGVGGGPPSIELARLIGIPSPLPSPHSSVVGRGNRPAAWWWCQDTPQALLGPTWRLHSAREQFILIVRFVRGAPSRVNDAVVAHERFA